MRTYGGVDTVLDVDGRDAGLVVDIALVLLLAQSLEEHLSGVDGRPLVRVLLRGDDHRVSERPVVQT